MNKRRQPTRSPMRKADSQVPTAKRQRDAELGYEASSPLQASSSHATASTRSASENPLVVPFTESDEVGGSTSPFQCAIAALQSQTAQMSAERECLLNDKKRLQHELDQEIEKVKTFADHNAQVVAEKDALIEAKGSLEGTLAQQRDKMVELETTLARQKEQVTQLTNQRDSLHAAIHQRDNEIARKVLEISNLETDMDQFERERNHLRDQLKAEKERSSRELAERDELKDRVDAELERVRVQRDRIDTELDSLRDEYDGHLASCKSAIAGLNAELATCKETLKLKNQAARLVEEGYALHRKAASRKYARKLFDEAIALDVDAMLPRFHKASGYYQQTDYAECAQTCIEALAAAQGAAKCVMAIFYDLAAAASVKQADIPWGNLQQLEEKPEQLARVEDAVQFYGQSLANYGDEAVERQHKRYAEVLRDVVVNPGRSQEALQRGNAFFQNRDYEKAVEQYDEAVRRDPGNVQLYLTRAWCHLKRTPVSCSDAIRDCKRALELDPNNAKAYIRLGAAQQAQGHLDRAEQSYRKALELDPTESEAEGALSYLRCPTRT